MDFAEMLLGDVGIAALWALCMANSAAATAMIWCLTSMRRLVVVDGGVWRESLESIGGVAVYKWASGGRSEITYG